MSFPASNGYKYMITCNACIQWNGSWYSLNSDTRSQLDGYPGSSSFVHTQNLSNLTADVALWLMEQRVERLSGLLSRDLQVKNFQTVYENQTWIAQIYCNGYDIGYLEVFVTEYDNIEYWE